MRPKTRLRRHLEPGWTLEIPGGMKENPLTGNLHPTASTRQAVAVSIQERSITGMTETGMTSVVDERVAVILPEDPEHPPMEVPATAVLRSPTGEAWNAASKGIIRRSARRRPVYTAVHVRRAKEGDHR